jgi:hypothetical protein
VLYGVTVVSPIDIWAVGAYSYGERTVAMTMRWNGATWSLIGVPNPGWDFSELRGVDWAAGGALWAVGSFGDGGARYTFVLRWNGTAWDMVPSPNPHPWDQGLNAIAAVSANDIWAVGYKDSQYEEGLIIRWTGSAWNIVSPPSYAWGTLKAVAAVSANDVWATGDLDGYPNTPLWHWNGTAWTVVTYQSTEPVDVHGLAAVSAADIWAVGAVWSGMGYAAAHWNGTAWYPDTTAILSAYEPLNAVAAASPADLWTVGSLGDPYQPHRQTTLVMRNTQPCPDPVNTPTRTPTPLPTNTPTRTPTPYPTPTVCPGCCPIYFPDVPIINTFYPFIRCLACRDILSGYADGNFRPNNPVTRGQLSKIVSNSAGFSDPPGAQLFQDVPPGSTFHDWVQRLASRSIMSGYACGGVGEPCVPPQNRPYFRPNNNATRGQISKIVSNAAGFSEPPGTQLFEDVAPGSTFYDWVQRLASRSIMSGYPCGGAGEPCVPPQNRPYFRPNNNATRGQTAKIVANTFFPNCQTPNKR